VLCVNVAATQDGVKDEDTGPKEAAWQVYGNITALYQPWSVVNTLTKKYNRCASVLAPEINGLTGNLTEDHSMQKPNPHLFTELKFVVPLLFTHPAPLATSSLTNSQKLYISRRTYSAGPSAGNCRPAEAAKVKFIVRT